MPTTQAPSAPPAPRPAHPVPRALHALLTGLPAVRADRDLTGVQVTGMTHDSRAVQPGDLYAALPGQHVHGADFAPAAVSLGAVALLVDAASASRCAGLGVPLLVTDDARAVLGVTAVAVHGAPAEAMTVLGVTGTNGKTTTAFLLDAGLRAAGHTTGLLGTVQTRLGDEVLASVRTTPEATDLQALLALMSERGVTAVSMEVSSHALVLGRVDGLMFDVAAFTNLTQDHLDFHHDMADYEAAKALLFTPAHAGRAVVNAADEAGARLARAARIPTATYDGATDDGGAYDGPTDWRAEELELRPGGSTFRLVGPGIDLPAALQLPGGFNVANALAALATLVTAGVDAEAAVDGVAALAGVPGRMERVDAGQPFLALVDYAHTPDAVDMLLRAVRAVTSGRVLVVLGCGGDRDRSKRPLMGAAAVRGADIAVLTSDNPRSEDPVAILEQMAVGAPGALREVDRRAAIARAVALARPGDTVVIAGKGHETGQETGGIVTPFNDRLVLLEVLST